MTSVFRTIFEHAPDAVIVVDSAGKVAHANREAHRVFGYQADELAGLQADALVPGQPWAGGQVASVAPFGRRKDGSSFPVELSLSSGEIESEQAEIAIIRDVSEQGRESRLRETQELDAVGSLAAGVAHDFNNVLLVIRGLSDLLLKKMDDDELRERVVRINEAAGQAAELTHELLAFSRQQILRPELSDLNALVAESLAASESSLGGGIQVRSELEPALDPIIVDRGQLSRVISDLALSAGGAMPAGGTLTIRTENVALDKLSARAHPGLGPGAYVLLEVADSGQGMDDLTRARLFDPFFTTSDDSAGLGLATSFGIVRQSGGAIWVESEPGRGTTFKVYLPSAAEAQSGTSELKRPAV
ncbi:MAG TPA: PAS domain S-box protein [Gaiellaceae bacterium]|nr:PAS domain S-box protein [Gaiellaceae bacterium]